MPKKLSGICRVTKSRETDYFADDIEHDQVWSDTERRKEFGKSFQALCSL